jgi:hypothetical protein
MLHIAALFVAGTATLDESGTINATSIPMTSFRVTEIPLWATIPIVFIVHARAGGDYDPELYIACKDPAGVLRAILKASWHWPDDDDKPSKYRCFTEELSFGVESEGEYTIGAYYDAEAKIEMGTPIPISITPVMPDSG